MSRYEITTGVRNDWDLFGDAKLIAWWGREDQCVYIAEVSGAGTASAGLPG